MASGMSTSYTRTAIQKQVVSDRIVMTEPMEAPLLAALGLNSESKFKFTNTPGKLYSWVEDTYSPIQDAANDTDLTNDSTTTLITVTNGNYFQPGDVIKADSEYIWVSSISTNTLTVTRNYGGTQATHASDVTLYIHSRARLEGASASDSHFTEPTTNYNYSFIMQKQIEVSRSDALLKRYGIGDVVQWEIDKKMKELKRDLAKKPYHGQRKAGSATTPRDAGGFDTFITTNVTTLSGSPALTQKNVEDAVAQCLAVAPSPNYLLVCNTWPKRKFVDWYSGSVRTERTETMGGVQIDKIQSALGPTLNVMVDIYCPTNSLWILNTDFIGYLTLDEFFYEELGKSKDTESYGQIVGEYGFVVANNGAHAKITGFSTSS